MEQENTRSKYNLLQVVMHLLKQESRQSILRKLTQLIPLSPHRKLIFIQENYLLKKRHSQVSIPMLIFPIIKQHMLMMYYLHTNIWTAIELISTTILKIDLHHLMIIERITNGRQTSILKSRNLFQIFCLYRL